MTLPDRSTLQGIVVGLNDEGRLVLRTPESLRAFSLVCTHLGCLVEWQKDKKEFYCPCHDGRFDEFGDVLAGPPPIPLEQFPVSLEGETVTVGEI